MIRAAPANAVAVCISSDAHPQICAAQIPKSSFLAFLQVGIPSPNPSVVMEVEKREVPMNVGGATAGFVMDAAPQYFNKMYFN